MPPMALQGEVFFVKISSRGSQVEVSNVEDFASRLLTRQGALKPMVHSRWGSSMSSEAKGSLVESPQAMVSQFWVIPSFVQSEELY